MQINDENSYPDLQRGPEGQREIIDLWPDYIPFDDFKLPQFPVSCLPKVLAEYVIAVSESTQTPIDAAGSAVLAVMALCVQGKYSVQGKPDWVEPTNLYILNIAPPAERKSVVLRMLTKPVYDYESELNEKLLPAIIRYNDEKSIIENEISAIQKSKRTTKREEIAAKRVELNELSEVKEIRLIADDSTPEQLLTIMVNNNGRLAVISAEGGLFDSLQGRYTNGNINMEVYLKAHSGDSVRVDRRGRAEKMENPCLTMLLSIQPQVIDGLISNEAFRGRGLTARFLYSFPSSALGNRRFETTPISAEATRNYRDLCCSLLDIPQGEKTEMLTLSPEAYELLKQFFYDIEPQLLNELESIQDFAGKLPGAVLRMSAILHLAKEYVFAGKQPIPADTMRNAITLGYYFLEHAKKAFSVMGSDEEMADAKYVLRQLSRQPEMLLKRADILRCTRSRFDKVDELLPVLDLLCEYHYLMETPPEYTPATGRPPENRYALNPKYFDK
jgi:hypothetical protein